MKKIFFCLITIYAQYTAFTYCQQQMVRIIPVNKDLRTGRWNGLLGHDFKYGWSDFKAAYNQEQKMSLFIGQVLKKQTNGVYSLTPEQIEKVKSHCHASNGDIVYFIPVEYISGPALNKKMETLDVRDFSKSSFKWVPLDEVMRRRKLVSVPRGKTMVSVIDRDFQSIIRSHWYSIEPQLNMASSKRLINKFENSRASEKFIMAKRNQPDPKSMKNRFSEARNAAKAAKIADAQTTTRVRKDTVEHAAKKSDSRKRIARFA